VAEYAKNWKRLYRVLRNNVMINAVNYATKNGFEAVTCGHTHFAEDRVYNGIRYINTGAWTEMPTYYLRVTAGDMVLKKLDDAYETLQFTDSDQFDPTPTSKPHFR
jgi:UDP-2,3-diacylglucosamine pyrophosphatase LpxH